MSHGRIFQIRQAPVFAEDYIQESDFYEHWFVGAIADYVSGYCNREKDICQFRTWLEKFKTAAFDEKNDSFVLLPGGKESYFSKAYGAFAAECKKISEINLNDFASGDKPAASIRLLGYACNNEFGCYVINGEDELITCDEFIRFAKIGAKYYIGGTLDYHY